MKSNTPAPRRVEVLQAPLGMAMQAVPAWAAARSKATGGPVLAVGVPLHGQVLHWLESGQARGWVRQVPPKALDPAQVQTDCAAFQARGFVEADSALLALGRGAGRLPLLSWGEAPDFPALATPRRAARRLDLYAIVDSADRLAAVLDAGVKTVQVRIKRPAQADAAWHVALHEQLVRSITLARETGAELFINDHAKLALELGADGLHLGQEDLLALGDEGRAALAQRVAGGLSLGISSHSVWELCRARALAARYIACGPVWATITKDMPWVPQGLDNLGWWRRHAGTPVVAIGGILTPGQVEQVAATGVDGVCLVRGLGDAPRETLPAFEAALAQGRSGAGVAADGAAWDENLHPSLTAPG